MRIVLIMAMVLQIGAFSQCVVADEQQSKRRVNVTGQSAVSVTPDAFSLSVILEEKGPVLSKLNKQLTHRLTSVVQFLLASGVEEKQIQSMNVNVNPWFEHSPNGRENKGFILSRELRVTSSELGSYDALIDGMLSRGVDRLQQFSLVNTNANEAYKLALVGAVKDATARARLLAAEMNVALGPVISVSELPGPMPSLEIATMRERAQLATALPGESTITASVSVSFELIEK